MSDKSGHWLSGREEELRRVRSRIPIRVGPERRAEHFSIFPAVKGAIGRCCVHVAYACPQRSACHRFGAVPQFLACHSIQSIENAWRRSCAGGAQRTTPAGWFCHFIDHHRNSFEC